MHLFCLIGALVTSITDGRISSSSSSSQRVGGSAVELTPNRRDLQRALVDDSEPHYCTATALRKQRGVVDWQGKNNKCNKCEGGQAYWPCGVDDLCTGFCTPKDVWEKVAVLKEQIGELEEAEKAVCDERLHEERLRLAAAATESPTAASDCTAINLKKDDLEARVIQLEETVTNVNAENVYEYNIYNKYITVIMNGESNSFLWNRMEQECCLLCVYRIIVTRQRTTTDVILIMNLYVFRFEVFMLRFCDRVMVHWLFHVVRIVNCFYSFSFKESFFLLPTGKNETSVGRIFNHLFVFYCVGDAIVSAQYF